MYLRLSHHFSSKIRHAESAHFPAIYTVCDIVTEGEKTSSLEFAALDIHAHIAHFALGEDILLSGAILHDFCIYEEFSILKPDNIPWQCAYLLDDGPIRRETLIYHDISSLHQAFASVIILQDFDLLTVFYERGHAVSGYHGVLFSHLAVFLGILLDDYSIGRSQLLDTLLEKRIVFQGSNIQESECAREDE